MIVLLNSYNIIIKMLQCHHATSDKLLVLPNKWDDSSAVLGVLLHLLQIVLMVVSTARRNVTKGKNGEGSGGKGPVADRKSLRREIKNILREWGFLSNRIPLHLPRNLPHPPSPPSYTPFTAL